ncbi:MAG: hypothetical protein J5J06_17095 [Phycisphaerae bacterium]|nr:hypothetical protein [Phycisphaerae bacterium]
MDFLKRHAFYIASIGLALLGIALLVTGVQAMGRVPKEMDKARSLYSSLNQLSGSAVNDRVIRAEEERIAAARADYDAVLAKANTLYGWEPLVEGVFPTGTDEQRRKFRREYNKAMRALLDTEKLRWGQPADQAAIDLMKDRIEDELYREQFGKEGEGAARPPRPVTGPEKTPAGILTYAGARLDAAARANMAAAQRIYLYATPIDAPATREYKPVPSLDFYGTMTETGTVDAPFPEDCWHAQIAYWVQKDVIQAIEATNNEVADELKANETPRWVGTMAVKDIISIRVFTGYIEPEEESSIIGAAPGGRDPALPPATSANVFTHNANSPLYEVKQFTLKLVMDQREISRFVEKLCANSFYTLLRVSYVAEPVNRNMMGKIYGSGPVVSVVMDFDVVMLGDVFRPLMPPIVCDNYGISCPAPPEEEP